MVTASLAEDFDDQIRESIDHQRRLHKSRRGINHTGKHGATL